MKNTNNNIKYIVKYNPPNVLEAFRFDIIAEDSNFYKGWRYLDNNQKYYVHIPKKIFLNLEEYNKIFELKKDAEDYMLIIKLIKNFKIKGLYDLNDGKKRK